MRRSTRWKLLGSAALGAWLAFVGAAGAAEECDRFLEGLRERGYYDVALEYLDAMRASPQAPEEFKQRADYEAGAILIESARVGRVVATREKQLAEAEGRFGRFLQEHADHPLAASAKTQLANVLVERGRIKTEQAGSPTTPADQQNALRGEARRLFGEAQKLLETLDKQFVAELAKLPKIIPPGPEGTQLGLQQEQLRKDLLQARLALAQVLYETAQTYPEGSEDRKKTLSGAAAKYHEFYEKYSTRLAGLYALMYEGRCHKELGDSKKAFEVFNELFSQPDEPQPFRVLKNKAAVLGLETALLPTVKKYQQAVEMYREWDRTSQGWEDTTVEGAAIKCLSGEAALEYARTLDKDKPDQAKTRREMLALAKTLFREGVRFPSDYQQRARMLAMAPELLGGEEKPPEPTSFAEARDRAKLALDQMAAAELNLRLDQEKRILDNVEKYQQEIDESRQEAIKYLKMAMGMTDADTPIDDINMLRYYLAYLYWSTGDADRAAVMGEFLATRYPTGAGRQAAKIAMAAYAKMFTDAPAEDRQFEKQRLTEMAEYIAKRWSGEPDADEAWKTLISVAVLDRDLDKATEYLDKIPPESPRRGEAELATGQALWAAYLRATTATEGPKPPQSELDAMVARAQSTLEKGIERMRGAAEVSPTLASAVLSLAQINIDAGQADKAIQWLEDPKIGALTLVKAKHEAANRPNYPVEAYKAALRGYVATQQLDKAEQAMKALETLTAEGGDEKAAEKLTRIYISLGYQLQKQLERLRNEGKMDQVKTVSQGFELFLTKISRRTEGNTFASLNWVATTFFSMGAGFDTGDDALSPEAENYFRKAAETYRTMLDRAAKEPDFMPAAAKTSVKVQLARCFRRMRQYREALALLLTVLKEKETVVAAQVEAAMTYQDWGQQQPEYYVFAIRGSQKYKEIWGWGNIARRVIRVPEYRNTFYDARYNLAVCRFRLALTKKDQERADLLKQAESDIVIVYKLYPKLGGKDEGCDEWYGKYDELLKTIQKMRGVRPDGLKAIETTPAAATASK